MSSGSVAETRSMRAVGFDGDSCRGDETSGTWRGLTVDPLWHSSGHRARVLVKTDWFC